ncbi:MAG: hypothetical protein H7Y43_17290 [Akkermansiaceae bacterium]|nr:hypothetical protein [Verrucomicrobiales bacterium]
MHLKHKTSWAAGVVLGALFTFAQPGFAQLTDEEFNRFLQISDSEQEDVWSRHFRVGALVGFNFKAEFSMNGTFRFSQNNPGPAGSGGVDRVYDDGYVKVDASGNFGNETWNWGYQNSTQYTNSTQQLHFHAAQDYTASGSSDVNSDAQVGFELAYGGHLSRWGRALVGWEFGFGYLPINIEDNRTFTGVSATRISHSFDASGIEIPDAPYNGTFTGPGALISDFALPGLGDSFTNSLSLTGGRSLDVTLYSFRLGPTLHWELFPRLAVAVSAGAAIGVLTGDLEFNESVLFPDGSTAVNVGSHSSTEITYGGYLSATVMYHVEEHGDFYLGVQYMPLSDATFSGAGREATLDMTGAVYVSFGINWPF